MIPMRDFLAHSERQAVIKAFKTFNMEMVIKLDKILKHDDTFGVVKVGYISRAELVKIRDAYKEKWYKTKHFSSKQASIRFNKFIKAYDRIKPN